ncbi:zinc finger protein-like [Tropilaelaps mercedesae]|uniref:Zinc finger protein-like n=1 Tax=Tropilaelaps mercedesae TaxID=418985 RepID=A0A1V9Y1H4_9ACAR|nr:zinc finger protein-like [Tropilaelaps mercedesae]
MESDAGHVEVDGAWYIQQEHPASFDTDSSDGQHAQRISTIAPLKINNFPAGSSSSVHQPHHYASLQQQNHLEQDHERQLVLSSLTGDDTLITHDYPPDYSADPQQQAQPPSVSSYPPEHRHRHHQQPQTHQSRHHADGAATLHRSSSTQVQHMRSTSTTSTMQKSFRMDALQQKYWPQKLFSSPAGLSRLNSRLGGGHVTGGQPRLVSGGSNSGGGNSSGAIDRKTCPVCLRRFRDGYDVRVHMRSHTRERPFPCPHCDYRASTKGSLKAHLLNKHSLQ